MNAGLYIHLPWCERRCPYCDFTIAVQSKPLFERYVDLICRQLDRARDIADYRTVYIGGGTPSMLPVRCVRTLGRAIKGAAPLSTEFTVEFNPEHAEPALLDAWREAGADRVSLGAQSLHEETLSTLGRAHRGPDVLNFVKLARAAGFKRISADVIYGVPNAPVGQSAIDAGALASLSGVDHISAYELTWEPATAFDAMRKRGRLRPASDDALFEEAHAVYHALKKAGMERYEVSSWSLSESARSAHNSAYWDGTPYVGLGVGAHSFVPAQWVSAIWGDHAETDRTTGARSLDHTDAMVRVAEERSIARFCDGRGRLEIEVLTPRMRFDEICMIRLRTAGGLALEELPLGFGRQPVDLAQRILTSFASWASRGFGEVHAGVFRPSGLGMDHADTLALELMDAADQCDAAGRRG